MITQYSNTIICNHSILKILKYAITQSQFKSWVTCILFKQNISKIACDLGMSLSANVILLSWPNCCQNPNLTTTQPKPNLSLVGFDTIITLHTPPTQPPHHRNSNSTRNNGPRGLKFCMQPHQAKLTTTQHNFNPTVFWGGGHISSPLG